MNAVELLGVLYREIVRDGASVTWSICRGFARWGWRQVKRQARAAIGGW